MRAYDFGFQAMLDTAEDAGLDIRWALRVDVFSRSSPGTTTMRGFWSGLDDRAFTFVDAAGTSRSLDFMGDCGLVHGGIPLTSSLDDNPLNVVLSINHPAVESAAREFDMRHAYCELYVMLLDGEALVSTPQLEYVGIVDEAPITTGAFGDESSISLSIRSELITQLRSVKPKFSSDAHQKSRLSTDEFSAYSGIVDSMEVKWYQG